VFSTKKSETNRRPERSILTCQDRSITFPTCPRLVGDGRLLKTCRRPGRRHVLSRFKEGFRQDRCNEIWAKPHNRLQPTSSNADMTCAAKVSAFMTAKRIFSHCHLVKCCMPTSIYTVQITVFLVIWCWWD